MRIVWTTIQSLYSQSNVIRPTEPLKFEKRETDDGRSSDLFRLCRSTEIKCLYL